MRADAIRHVPLLKNSSKGKNVALWCFMCVISLKREKTPSPPPPASPTNSASQIWLHNSSSHPPLLPLLSTTPELNCPLRNHLFLQVFKLNRFAAWPTVLMQQECRKLLLGAKQAAKGRDEETLTFLMLGSAAQEPCSCPSWDYIPYLQLKHHKLGITEKAP